MDVEEGSLLSKITVLRCSAMQDLTSIRDRMLRVSFMLHINESIREALMLKLNDANSLAHEWDGVVPSLFSETRLQPDRIKALLERLEGSFKMACRPIY